MEEKDMRKIEYRQDTLRYCYESAKERMKCHPEYAKMQKEIIKRCPYFRNEKKALKAAAKLAKGYPHIVRIWAKIKKDKEYSIQNYWIVIVRGNELKAAEYIGMLPVYSLYAY